MYTYEYMMETQLYTCLANPCINIFLYITKIHLTLSILHHHYPHSHEIKPGLTFQNPNQPESTTMLSTNHHTTLPSKNHPFQPWLPSPHDNSTLIPASSPSCHDNHTNLFQPSIRVYKHLSSIIYNSIRPIYNPSIIIQNPSRTSIQNPMTCPPGAVPKAAPGTSGRAHGDR